MAGIRPAGIVLQERDRHLLSELGMMRIIDREATKLVAGFGSTTRANARLLKLTRAGLLRKFFTGTVASGRKAVYTLSPRGAETVQATFEGIKRPLDRLIVGDRFVEHQSAINDAYLAIKYGPNVPPHFRLVRWLSFRRELAEGIKLKPDGYFEVQTGDQVRAMFLEVDLGTEALGVWQQKTGYYLQLALSGAFQQRFGQTQFRVLVVATSEHRMQHVRAIVAKQTEKIFWFTTFESINLQGFWSPCWLRPTGDQRHGLV
jgi:hypothetical protein